MKRLVVRSTVPSPYTYESSGDAAETPQITTTRAPARMAAPLSLRTVR